MIRLENIGVRFGSFEALKNINIHVKEGEFFTFLGPSGCGKTTTLRTSRTTTAKSTKSTSAKTTRSTADRSELYQKKLEELQKEYEKKQERVQDKLIDLEIQKEIDLAALDLYYASAGLAHGGAYEAEKNRILSQYEQEAAACRQQGEDWQREYADKVKELKEQYGQE